MAEVLVDISDATPAWLTVTLRERGDLRQGHVTQIALRRVGASSNVAYLTASYSQDASDGVPEHLVLKMTDPELECLMPRRNRAEIALYQALSDDAGGLPLVRCYDAVYVEGQQDRFHLLLDDPSVTTHVATPYSAAPPTFLQCRQIIDALTIVHARYWNDHRLETHLQRARSAELHTGALSTEFVSWAAEQLPGFLSDLGDRLPLDRADLYARIGANVPERLLHRRASGRNLTLTHGDVHAGNFLYPRDAAGGTPYIIDWKRAAISLGANDLAYMMALYWFPAVRARWEEPLLRYYHERLVERGVTDYAWDELWDDYRLAVLQQFYEAVWGWSVRQNSAIWWNHLERVTLAIVDLRCLEVV